MAAATVVAVVTMEALVAAMPAVVVAATAAVVAWGCVALARVAARVNSRHTWCRMSNYDCHLKVPLPPFPFPSPLSVLLRVRSAATSWPAAAPAKAASMPMTPLEPQLEVATVEVAMVEVATVEVALVVVAARGLETGPAPTARAMCLPLRYLNMCQPARKTHARSKR